MQFNSEQLKKILMAIKEDELKQMLKEYMLENNFGYMRIVAMINVNKDIKAVFYSEEDEPEDKFKFNQN